MQSMSHSKERLEGQGSCLPCLWPLQPQQGLGPPPVLGVRTFQIWGSSLTASLQFLQLAAEGFSAPRLILGLTEESGLLSIIYWQDKLLSLW